MARGRGFFSSCMGFLYTSSGNTGFICASIWVGITLTSASTSDTFFKWTVQRTVNSVTVVNCAVRINGLFHLVSRWCWETIYLALNNLSLLKTNCGSVPTRRINETRMVTSGNYWILTTSDHTAPKHRYRSSVLPQIQVSPSIRSDYLPTAIWWQMTTSTGEPQKYFS